MRPTTERTRQLTVDTPGAADSADGRVDLFGVPVWTIRLEIDPASLVHLVDDIDRQLAVHRLAGVPGQQTGSIMHHRTEPWWLEYHRALISATDRLAADLRPVWSERFWQSWGLRFEGFSDYRAETWWIHSHQPATYSCVIALSEPEHLAHRPQGATQLRNPQAHLEGLTGVERDWWGPARPLAGLIFPGPIEHHPAVPRPGSGSWATPRTLIVSDVCYY